MATEKRSWRQGLSLFKDFFVKKVAFFLGITFFASAPLKGLEFKLGSPRKVQEKDVQYVENGMFYITKRDHLLASKLRYSGDIGMLVIPQLDSYQIDTLDDLRLVTNLLKIRESNKNELGEIEDVA